MAQVTMPLDHERIKIIKIAANALHMARTQFLIYLQNLEPDARSRFSDTDRADYSDFRLFRERLEYWGVVDRLIDSPLEGTRTLAAFDPRLKALFSSDANFIHITLEEMPFSGDDWAKLDVVKSQPLDRFDMELPLCELHPSPFLTKLRAIVLRHLEAYFAAPVVFPLQKEVLVSKPKKLGIDRKFVAEGVELVNAGDGLSANHAAELLLLRHGWACRGAKDSKGKIIAASYEAAKARLQRKIYRSL